MTALEKYTRVYHVVCAAEVLNGQLRKRTQVQTSNKKKKLICSLQQEVCSM